METVYIGPISQQVVKRMREMIRKGILKKGDKIVEKTLCQAMGISRTPFREALHILSSEGLIQLVPNKGAYVAEPSMQDIREMFCVMSILEGTAARICAEKMNAEDLKKLENLYRKMEKFFHATNYEKYMAVNHCYHALVQELAGNKILSEVINGLMQKILLYRYRQIYQPDRLNQSMQEHRNIQEAFRKKDPEAAERLMRKHLTKQCEALESVYSETLDSSNSKRLVGR